LLATFQPPQPISKIAKPNIEVVIEMGGVEESDDIEGETMMMNAGFFAIFTKASDFG
jgi:hypothetical protein